MDSDKCLVCQCKLMREQVVELKKEALVIEQQIQELVSEVTKKKNKIKKLEEQIKSSDCGG